MLFSVPVQVRSKAKRNVAQFGSALHLGCKGRRFKSCHSDKGEVSEWLMVPVLKTGVSNMTEGSNPSLSDLPDGRDCSSIG